MAHRQTELGTKKLEKERSQSTRYLKVCQMLPLDCIYWHQQLLLV
jgi:hypothetical protein